MKRILLVLTFVIINLHILTAQGYEIKSFQDEYIQLTDYSSLQLNNLGACCDMELEFGFDFPYFDKLYNSIMGAGTGIYSFPDNIFAIRLLGFIYEWDQVFDPAEIPSDIRYSSTEINNKKVLVIQYTMMRLASDTSIEEYDSHVNFQHRFWEDGTIDIIFGDKNLENSPNYVPGEGLFLLVNGDSLVNLGPELGLIAPDAEFEIGGNGNYNDIVQTEYLGRLNNFGPEGWVIRFKKTANSLSDANSERESIVLFPNPSTFEIKIEPDVVLFNSSYKIIGKDGRIVENKPLLSSCVDISRLRRGQYTIVVTTRKEIVLIDKIIKI